MFQAYFRKVHKDLKKVNALSIQNSAVNQAEMLQELKSHQAKMMMEVTNEVNLIISTSNGTNKPRRITADKIQRRHGKI